MTHIKRNARGRFTRKAKSGFAKLWRPMKSPSYRKASARRRPTKRTKRSKR